MKNMSPIIPVSDPNCQVKSWKNLLKSAIKDPIQLLSEIGLEPTDLNFPIAENTGFAVRVPQPFIDKMQLGNPQDPLLLQVLSQQAENLAVAGYTNDPLEEHASSAPGILHKYHGRVLLMLASACAVNCRYCFRRHFPYQDKVASGKQLQQSIDYISEHQEISEVILSGGDPLMVSDSQLSLLLSQLNQIPHLKRLRIHTRLPVVIPQRITQELCNILATSHLNVSMVLHINHANEIDELFTSSVKKLRDSGIQLFNQSVLLKDINDNVSVLAQLSEQLFAAYIVPYYIHLLDKVAGAAHFDIPKAQAIELVEALRNRLPGYLVPRLAIEEPGEKAKTIIA